MSIGSDPGSSSSSGSVDTSAAEDLAAEANALYLQVQEMALNYERATAGAKLAMAKAKAIQT